MLKLAGGDSEGIYVRNFLQLQRAFIGNSGVHPSSDKEDIVSLIIFLCQIRNLPLLFQHLFYFFRDGQQFFNIGAVNAVLQRSFRSAHIQTDEIHADQLRRICLRRSYRDFRTRPGVENIIGLPGHGTSYHIYHGENPCAFALGFTQRRQSIQRLAGLTDSDEQSILVDKRISVAEFRSDIDFHTDPR